MARPGRHHGHAWRRALFPLPVPVAQQLIAIRAEPAQGGNRTGSTLTASRASRCGPNNAGSFALLTRM